MIATKHSCTSTATSALFLCDILNSYYTHVTAVAFTPLTTRPQTQAELVRSPVRGQEQEQPDFDHHIIYSSEYSRLFTPTI